jgi:hypothetical protein
MLFCLLWREIMTGRRLLEGATVWAGPDCRPRRAWLLVADGRVEALGDQEDSPRPAADEVVSLPGCHVLPGFVDVHLHLSQAAWSGQGHDGSSWQSLAEALRAISAAAGTDPGPGWLLFWGVARWRWPEGRLPTAAELDQAAPGRLVLVSTADMHRGAVSPPALAALGLDGQRRARQFGADITRDRRGRPTGELWEAPYAAALQHGLTALAAESGQAHKVLAAEAARYLRLGITHAHDPYVPPDWHEQMAELRAATPLRLSWATGSPDGMHCRPAGPGQAPDGPYGDAAREVKLFADGGDRCALRLPRRAVAGLAGGAISESVRLRALGPLREAMRRKVSIGPGGLCAAVRRRARRDNRDRRVHQRPDPRHVRGHAAARPGAGDEGAGVRGGGVGLLHGAVVRGVLPRAKRAPPCQARRDR